MANIEEKVENLLSKIIQDLGYELYDVNYVKEGKDYFLRIFIDKPEGIDLEDCEKVSNGINDKLDEADYIKEQYFLEVSSPGIQRVLRKDKHLQDNIDKLIEINLYQPIEGKKHYQGILKGYNKEEIRIQIDKIDTIIKRNNISLIKVVYLWD